MFKSLFGLVKDLTEITLAPVEIAADLARAVTKPVADMAKDTADALKELSDDDD